jgi:hypothetical protein
MRTLVNHAHDTEWAGLRPRPHAAEPFMQGTAYSAGRGAGRTSVPVEDSGREVQKAHTCRLVCER